jgi:hypothetical protein
MDLKAPGELNWTHTVHERSQINAFFSFMCKRLKLFWVLLMVVGISNISKGVTIVSDPVFIKATNAALAGILNFVTDVPTRASVSVSDGGETWNRNFYEFSTDHSLPLFGFKPDRNYEISVTAIDRFRNETVSEEPVPFTTEPLPSDFPNITLLTADPDRMEPGYTLFRVDVHSDTYWYVVMVDNSGEVVWYNKTPSTADARLLENGNLFLPSASRFTEMNLLGDTVKTWDVPGNLQIDPHDGVPTDHGTILYLSGQVETLTGYPTGSSAANMTYETISARYESVVEISATNATVLNKWDPITLLDPRRRSYLVVRSASWDTEHSNAVIEDPRDDSIIVSMRHQNALIKFSRSTGKLRWILGPHEGWGPQWQPYLLTPVGSPFAWQYGQHAPVITKDGNLMLFDDGNFRAMPFDSQVLDSNNYSRAVEYKIDEDKMEISQVWDYGRDNSADRIYSGFKGNAEPLPKTGNVLIGFPAISYVNGVPPSSYGTSATMARIQEVTHDATPEVVFDLSLTMFDKPNSTFKNCTIYRCHRVPDLYGHPALPVTDLIVTSENGSALLEFTGDPVRTFAVESSKDLNNWAEIGVAEADDDGLFTFVADPSDGAVARFYRIVTH